MKRTMESRRIPFAVPITPPTVGGGASAPGKPGVTIRTLAAGALLLGLFVVRAPAAAQDSLAPLRWPESAQPSVHEPLLQEGDPLGRIEPSPRGIQAMGGLAGWFAGGFPTALVGSIYSGCAFGDPHSEACRRTRTATLLAAGFVSASLVEALGRDRRQSSAYVKVFAGAAAGLGFAALTGATSGDDGAMAFSGWVVPLQVGGALLGDYWASRTQE